MTGCLPVERGSIPRAIVIFFTLSSKKFCRLPSQGVAREKSSP